MNEALRQLPAGSVVFPMKTRVWLAANCTTFFHEKSNSEAGLICHAVDSAALARQYGVTSALLLFVLFASASMILEPRLKAGKKSKR